MRGGTFSRTVLFLICLALFRMPSRALPGDCRRGTELAVRREFAAAQEPLWRCILAGAPRDAAYDLTQTYRALRNYEDGWARAEQALRQQPASIDVLYVAAFLKFRMGRHQESVDFLERAFKLDNLDWRIHHVFALNYIALNIRPGAIAELELATQLNPENAELHYQLARVYYTDEMRLEESIAESHKALALFPEYPEVYLNLALCYEALSQNEKAIENYRQAMSLAEKHGRQDEWFYMNYAEFLIKQGEAGESLPLLNTAIRLNPKSARAHYLLGKSLRRLDRPDESRDHLERAMALDPSESGPYFELGMLLQKRGDRARARQLLDRYKIMKEQERPGPPAAPAQP
jgi:tetratricopeptide (TPR) repeat protein